MGIALLALFCSFSLADQEWSASGIYVNIYVCISKLWIVLVIRLYCTWNIQYLASDPQPPQPLAPGHTLCFMVLGPLLISQKITKCHLQQLVKIYSVPSSQFSDPSLFSTWLRPMVPPVADSQTPVSPVSGPKAMVSLLLVSRPLMLLTSDSGLTFASAAHTENRVHLHLGKPIRCCLISSCLSSRARPLAASVSYLPDLSCKCLRYSKIPQWHQIHMCRQLNPTQPLIESWACGLPLQLPKSQKAMLPRKINFTLKWLSAFGQLISSPTPFSKMIRNFI